MAAVILGDYPLSGAVPWVSALLVPGVIGVTMTTIAGSHRPAIWAATGPLAAASLLWGVRIATGWGLDPVPGAAWAAVVLGLAWPLAYAGFVKVRGSPPNREPAAP
jgi:hypothetical protein